MVKYLKYKEKEWPIRVGYSALKAVKEKHGKSLAAISDEDVEVYETILEQALVSGHKATGDSYKKGDVDIIDMLDECFMEFVAMVPAFFPDTNAVKKGAGNGRKK